MLASSLASRVARGVSVVRIQHHTVLVLEVPDIFHPATLAAVILSLPGGAEVCVVRGVVNEGAIDDMLLGEADRPVVILFGDIALKCRVSGEGVAGTAVTLVFDRVHEAISSMIDGCGGCYSKTIPLVVIELGALGVVSGNKTQLHLLLVLSEIGEEVGLEPCSVMLA